MQLADPAPNYDDTHTAVSSATRVSNCPLPSTPSQAILESNGVAAFETGLGGAHGQQYVGSESLGIVVGIEIHRLSSLATR